MTVYSGWVWLQSPQAGAVDAGHGSGSGGQGVGFGKCQCHAVRAGIQDGVSAIVTVCAGGYRVEFCGAESMQLELASMLWQV